MNSLVFTSDYSKYEKQSTLIVHRLSGLVIRPKEEFARTKSSTHPQIIEQSDNVY